MDQAGGGRERSGGTLETLDLVCVWVKFFASGGGGKNKLWASLPSANKEGNTHSRQDMNAQREITSLGGLFGLGKRGVGAGANSKKTWKSKNFWYSRLR